MATAVRDLQRRERHAATAKVLTPSQTMLMPFRGKLGSVQQGFDFKPGFVYTQVRAISARINQNFDGWPSVELKKAYRTFLGKPVFVNHQNFDYKKARGKVVAARYVEAGDDKYIETVMEIDAHRFPELAHEIRTGGMDSVSMGVEAGFTICSVCNNKAIDVPDFCDHVKFHKGQTLHTASGPTLVYEKCYKLGFFELSYVFDPADETAVVSRVVSAGRIAGPDDTITQIPDPADHWGTGGGANHDTVGMPGNDPGIGKNITNEELFPQFQAPRSAAATPGAAPKEPGSAPGKAPKPSTTPPAALTPSTNGKAKTQAPKLPPSGSGVGMGSVAFGSITNLEATIQRLAYGEVEAPEDVDTLRDEDQNEDDDPFKHYIDSPQELQEPDLDRTKQLDRDQESEGLDADRRVEDVEDVQGEDMPRSRNDVLVDPRTGRRYIAMDGPWEDGFADHVPDGPMKTPEHLRGRPNPVPPHGYGGPGEYHGSRGFYAADGASDEDLITEAEDDLKKAEGAGAGDDFSKDPGSNAGGSDDDESDSDSDDDSDDEDDSDDDSDSDSDSGGDLPPWLQKGDDPDSSKKESRRNGGNRRSSNRNKGRKGASMGFAQRNRTATAQRPRNHYAGDDGHFDGGPYGENNQGEQEDIFLSQTPSPEAVSAPTPGDGTISNTENNLVARINRRSNDLQRDIIAYEQITGKRVGTVGDSSSAGQTPPTVSPFNPRGEQASSTAELYDPFGQQRSSRRRHADDGEWPSPGAQTVSGVPEKPTTVNPNLSGTDQQGLKGDFDDIALDSAETQPKDASRKYFSAFDQWVTQATGRKTASLESDLIRRYAARWCQAKGLDPQVLFPALGNELRLARRNEGRRANVRRTADDKLEVAAPQDRIDVEKPVSGDTDADAQASQFDLGDFGSNAGDNLADPELSPDSQTWAPGEGKTSNRKADGLTAVRYAEAYIAAGLAPDSPAEKWKIAGLAQTMRHGTIVDRIRLLDAVASTQRQAAARARTAGRNLGSGQSIPAGLGQRQMTAGMAYEAANDLSNDVALWIK